MKGYFLLFVVLGFSLLSPGLVWAEKNTGLQNIRHQGVLRHLGVPYANFVTGAGDGFDVDMIKGFADHLGVRYKFVSSSFANIICDLTGKIIQATGDKVRLVGECPIKGDIIATGFTVLPWREKVVNFSKPTFPTQVWLITSAKSKYQPVQPSGNVEQDIKQTVKHIAGATVLGLYGTCLDPRLYHLPEDVHYFNFNGSLNDLAPAVVFKHRAELTLLDVPDILVAFQTWPGKFKIIGPLSRRQDMACAFRKQDEALRASFDRYLKKIKQDGRYAQLMKKYYPTIYKYFPSFFNHPSLVVK